METEYDRLTRRSFEAKQRLDRAEEAYRNPGNTGVGSLSIARLRRDRALQRYLEIEALRKRAAPPPVAPPDGGEAPG